MVIHTKVVPWPPYFLCKITEMCIFSKTNIFIYYQIEKFQNDTYVHFDEANTFITTSYTLNSSVLEHWMDKYVDRLYITETTFTRCSFDVLYKYTFDYSKNWSLQKRYTKMQSIERNGMGIYFKTEYV